MSSMKAFVRAQSWGFISQGHDKPFLFRRHPPGVSAQSESKLDQHSFNYLFIVMRSVDGVAFASADVFSGSAQKTIV
jgi:hypothetical protein